MPFIMATFKKVINIPKYTRASTDVPFDKWLQLFEVRTAAAAWAERDKLCYFSDYLEGLFSGVLIQYCGARRAATIGASLLTTGLSVSFFTKGVSFLVFSAGFLAGTGHGIIINSSVACVCRYFDRRRGAALGLIATGGTVAALVFAKVYEYLLAEYGVRGAFLIIGVDRADCVYALTFYAVADAIGRLFVPYLSDYGLISNCGLLTISYLALCILQQAAPFVVGKFGVWALSWAFGLPCGYIMVGAPQILSTEIGPKNLPIAYGFMTTATATESFLRPLLIGFFRDNYGSYNGLFRLIGGMLVVSFLFTLGLWITGRSKLREAADVDTDSPVISAEPETATDKKNTHI
ncbi:hypothetical protein HPB51_015805 [Rhipicephalus microplus]|uniref:Monocarboxylate transporter n=1 Tax=Rhipicephalus microplus TaxID=6941 RepID=A0A9J6F452_RHIMP|nr:hypothetical protein HPB51_015805 [Rhipicephalus microplus]